MSFGLGLEWQLATRFLRGRSGRGWLSFSALISSLGVTVGVIVMIVVLSVMNGFDVELKEKVLSVTAHATLTGLDGPLAEWRSLADSAAHQPHVLAVAPFVEERALLAQGSHVSGVLVRGIDPAVEGRVASLDKHLKGGTFADLAAGRYGVLLGKDLAAELHVAIGDSVVLAAPHGTATPAGVVPRMRRLHVVGLIDSGLYEFDRNVAVLNIEDAARVFRLGSAVTGLGLKVDAPFSAGRIVHDVAVALGGGFFIYDWSRAHANFFKSIATTKSIMVVLLSLVIAVAAFNIIATLVMLVREKRSDIAILRTLGVSPGSLVGVFTLQGLVIGGLGLLIGVALGLAAAFNLKELLHRTESLIGARLFDSKIYFLEDLPSVVSRSDVLVIIAVVVALSALATLYPAWRAARTQPAEALRHD